jgi:hypothetical protein
MTDKELLELSAKATFYEMAERMLSAGWNPLENDEACAHLEAEHYIDIDWSAECVAATANRFDAIPMWEDYKDHEGSQQKARRYAVVRAAAEIGKQKE